MNTVLKPFTVANGEAVCVFVADWVEEPIPGVFAVQFDPPLSFPTDLASCRPPSDSAEALVEAALRVRDAERASEGSIPPADLERLLEQWVKRSCALKTLGSR